MNSAEYSSERPVIGILGWEEADNEKLYGSLAHPDAFRFPVLYKRVKGACYETIIERPGIKILEAMIEAAREMEEAGVKAITTSCGFNAIFQDSLADAVRVPMFSSALIQVPMVCKMLGDRQKTGIITANKTLMTKEHLERSGISDSIPVCVSGIEDTQAFSNICLNPKPALLDIDEFRDDVVGIARALVESNSNVGAIVLEMTVLHVFANDIKKAVDLPVFDIVTLTNYIFNSVVRE